MSSSYSLTTVSGEIDHSAVAKLCSEVADLRSEATANDTKLRNGETTLSSLYADKGEDFQHLTKSDRSSILQILRETKKGLPDYWQAKK